MRILIVKSKINKEINLYQFGNGLYFVQGINGKTVSSQKLIIQK